MLHRTRDLLVRQRTMLVNALRGHMAEMGIVAPQGISRVADLVAALLGENNTKLPRLARYTLRGLAAELETLGDRVKEIEVAILAWHKDNEASRRLATVPGIGPITASSKPFSIYSLGLHPDAALIVRNCLPTLANLNSKVVLVKGSNATFLREMFGF